MDQITNTPPKVGNYLEVPTGYTTGFIDVDDPQRKLQGLPKQSLANSCTSIGLPGTNWSPMYPLTNARWDYGPGTPADNCTCLQYLQAP